MPKRHRHPVLRLLLGVVVLLVLAVVAAGVAVTLLVDPNSFKPRIEAAVDRATGGTLDLNGPMRLGLGLPPHLVAEDIVLRRPDGSTLRLARLGARVAILPLLTGEVDIVRLDLLRPQLTLTGTAPPPAVRPAPPPPQPGPAAPAAAMHGPRLRVAVSAVHVEDGQVTWRGSTVAVPRLDAAAAVPGGSLVVSGELVSTGRRLMLSGETGPAGRLFSRSARTPWPVQLVLQGERARLAVRGTLGEPLRVRGYALQVDAAATDLAAFAPFLPVPLPTLHDISVSARLVDAGQARPAVSALTLHVAGLDLDAAVPGLALVRADVTAPDMRQPAHADLEATLHGMKLHALATIGPLGVTLPVALTAEAAPALQQVRAALNVALRPRPAVNGTFAARRIDLAALLAALPSARAAAPAPAAPAPGTPAPARTARLFSERPIHLASLRAADADLQISVGTLQAGGIAYSDVAGHLQLKDGRLTLDKLTGQAPGGALAGSLAVDASVAAPPMALALHAPTLALAPFAAALGFPGQLDGTAALDADLKAAGATPHALAASLGGHLVVSVADADIDNSLLVAVLGDVVREARLPVSALGGPGRTRLRCVDLRLDAAGGRVNVARLLADTPRLTVEGGGTMDLGAETLNLHLRPMLKVGPGVVVPVHVSGTLRDPKPKLESGAAGQRALLGALAGALAGVQHGGGDPCAPAAGAGR